MGMEVVNCQLRGSLGLARPSIVENLIDDSGIPQSQQSAVEASFEFSAPLLRQCGHPFSQRFGFKEIDGHELTAARSAPGFTGNRRSFLPSFFADPSNNRVFQVLNDRQELSESGLPRRQVRTGVKETTSYR
jgi:hypothetical protein